jgi:hypothetical protein
MLVISDGGASTDAVSPGLSKLQHLVHKHKEEGALAPSDPASGAEACVCLRSACTGRRIVPSSLNAFWLTEASPRELANRGSCARSQTPSRWVLPLGFGGCA